MLKKKAIVVSQNSNLSKLIEYELMLLGYDVKTNTSSENFTEADLLIYDSTSIALDAHHILKRFIIYL